jgi:hypothetical protein
MNSKSKLYFPVATQQQQQTSKPVLKFSKRATETNKMLRMFTDMKHCLVRMSSNGLKFSEKDMRTLTMIQGVGSHQLLKI